MARVALRLHRVCRERSERGAKDLMALLSAYTLLELCTRGSEVSPKVSLSGCGPHVGGREIGKAEIKDLDSF